MEIRDGKIKEDGVRTITRVGEGNKIKAGEDSKIKGDGDKIMIMVGEDNKIKGDGGVKEEMV